MNFNCELWVARVEENVSLIYTVGVNSLGLSQREINLVFEGGLSPLAWC